MTTTREGAAAKSAMEALRGAAHDSEHLNPTLRSSTTDRLLLAARAVLAEHDAAQQRPPSERAQAWREDVFQSLDRLVNSLVNNPGADASALRLRCERLHDEAVRNWRDAEPVATSEDAQAWREKVVVAIDTQCANPTIASWQAVLDHLDEAVRRMSQLSQQPAAAPKRLRAGWREDVRDAFQSYEASLPGYESGRAWRRLSNLLDEAETSAAPEPLSVDAAIEITALKTEIRRLLNQVDRANAIIDALLHPIITRQA